MNTDGTGFYTCKECHKTETLCTHTTTDHKEEQLEDQRSIGVSGKGPVLDVYDDNVIYIE